MDYVNVESCLSFKAAWIHVLYVYIPPSAQQTFSKPLMYAFAMHHSRMGSQPSEDKFI